MRCYHLTPNPPTLPACNEPCQWLEVGNNQLLLVHSDCHMCIQPETRLPHLMLDSVVSAELATALSQWDVLPTDTVAQAMLKVAREWAAAWP